MKWNYNDNKYNYCWKITNFGKKYAQVWFKKNRWFSCRKSRELALKKLQSKKIHNLILEQLEIWLEILNN